MLFSYSQLALKKISAIFFIFSFLSGHFIVIKLLVGQQEAPWLFSLFEVSMLGAALCGCIYFVAYCFSKTKSTDTTDD